MEYKRSTLLFTGAALAGLLGWVMLTPARSDEAGMLPYRDARALALGREIYDAECAACHGGRMEGQLADWRQPLADGKMPAPPHDETGHTWHHPDRLLFLITKYGSARVIGGGYESDMAGFGETLSDDEILSVLAYIKSTWPPEVIARHNQMNAAAEKDR